MPTLEYQAQDYGLPGHGMTGLADFLGLNVTGVDLLIAWTIQPDESMTS